MLDLLIIGAGLAGLSAAWAASNAGLQVRVVAKGLGSMHWSAGSFDVLGFLPGGDRAAVTDPWAAIQHLPEEHPYRRLSADKGQDLLASFQADLSSAGLAYVGAASRENTMLPSPVGASRPVFLAPSAQAGGDLADNSPLLIVGFEGMRDFYPALIAENLCAQGHAARAALLPLDVLTSQRDRNTVQLAHLLDRPPIQNQLGVALRKLRRADERIGLPAILGLHRHAEAMAALRAQTNATIFEIPTLPPSVPGIRLHDRLRSLLLERGVRVEAGMAAVSHAVEGDQIRWVETETSARALRHRAHAYLLATGGILGGGFDSDASGRIWETVFGLPLTIPQDRRAWFRPAFLDPDGQPVFHGGVMVDDRFQPVNASGTPLLANLWAAGSLLANADPMQERSLEGIAIVSGMAAAEQVSAYIAQ